jgi:RecA-family ATPase
MTKVTDLAQTVNEASADNFGRKLQPIQDNGYKSPFVAKNGNEWMREAMTKPVPKQMFGELVIEGEITVCFASTNVGKSILAVQIGQAIAAGKSPDPFPVPPGGQKVLYFDFELSGRQFAKRYSNQLNGRFIDPFEFSENLIRLESEYASPDDGESLTDYYIRAIGEEVKEHGAKVIIIDNITWINSRLEKGSDAAPFMQQLAKLKREKELTIIILAHTPKRPDNKPLDIYDLQGSAMIGNFIDAAFAIGRSKQDSSVRYIKQVKCRDGEIVFDGDNVAVCRLEKENSFLGYTFRHYEEEYHHLRNQSDEEQDKTTDRIFELHSAGKSFREIAREVGTNHMKVKRIVEKGKTQNNDENPF